MKDGFSWFPELHRDERVLVFVDAKVGCILNLDGSLFTSQTSHSEFFQKFGDRSEALAWASIHRPSRAALSLLYDKEKKEEYVSTES